MKLLNGEEATTKEFTKDEGHANKNKTAAKHATQDVSADR